MENASSKPMRVVLSAKGVAYAVSPQGAAHRVRCVPQMPGENQLRIALDFHGAVSVPKAAPYETDLLEDTAKAKALSRKQMLRG